MKKPMTDFVNRGGLGELLAAATEAIEVMIFAEVGSATIDRLEHAVNDGEKAREDEATAAANPMKPRAVCHCGQLYFVKLVGPRSVGYCSDACAPAEDVPRGVV